MNAHLLFMEYVICIYYILVYKYNKYKFYIQLILFFSNFFVYIVYLYLIYWKSIIYRETIDCLFCFSCLQPFCENTWMTDFANFWFGGNLREWFEAKKFFLIMNMALYTIYKGHPGTAAGGLISTLAKFLKYKNLSG